MRNKKPVFIIPTSKMFGFQLGREFRLSIAEISSVFGDSTIPVFWNKNIFILKNLEKKEILDKANFLGGTIKIFEIEKENDFKEIILKKNITPKKFVYGVSIFGEKSNLKETLISSKKILKQNNISSRFINKNFENLNSAQIIGDKLVEKGTDFTIINSEEKIYIGKTIWVQDINEYSKRDYGKLRDIQTGMLPPKLAQIMINLSQSINGKFIYDPFVGLGTILIESGLMSFHSVYGSDINEKMIEFSNKNLSELKNKGNVFNFEIFKFDSRDIGELDSENSELAKLMQNGKVNIVTEGFLGEIMTKKNICEQRIMIQRKNLQKLYEKFFFGLKKLDFFGNIIISFPFWELNGKYIYFEEGYNIIKKYCLIQKFFLDKLSLQETKTGSLLYKRDNQLVGREVFKFKIKNN